MTNKYEQQRTDKIPLKVDFKSDTFGVENKGALLWHFPGPCSPSSLWIEWNSYWVAPIIMLIMLKERYSRTGTGYIQMQTFLH